MINLYKNIKEVYSYHVNVGHGNTSFIVIQYTDKTIKSIGIDCSVTDDGKRCKSNINDCISEIKNKFSINDFELDLFLLTHPHNDHYSGIMHLIKQNHIVGKTEIWLNNAFIMHSAFFLTIKRNLFKMGCRFFHPVHNMTSKRHLFFADIWYPENIIIKKGTLSKAKTLSKLIFQEESNPNNTSVVVSFNFPLDGKLFSILFTGDIEKEGWDKVNCPPYLGHIQYYCVSHHGSLNGHERNVCHLGRSIRNIIDCNFTNTIQKSILMGKDKSYMGIYSTEVLSSFGSKIEKTEGNRFIELQFKNGNVKKY